MTPTTITNTEVCRDSSIVVTTEAESNTTTTKSCTDNQTTTITETDTRNDNDCNNKCPCGNLDLRKLLEETRCFAFKSSNISAATANSVMIFVMKILQEIIISECRSNNADIDRILLIAAAIGEIGQVIKVYNPQPFNS